MLVNPKYPIINKPLSISMLDEDEEDLSETDRSSAEVSLTKIISTIIDKNDEICMSLPTIMTDVDKIFKQHLSNVIYHDNPHDEALRMQESCWRIYKGKMLDILRLKCIIIGYNPDVWVDGKNPHYPKIQL